MSNWINTVLLATVAALHLRRKGKKGMFTAAPLVFLSAAQFLRAASQGVGSPEWLWGAENAATLLALGLFAIVVDLRSDNLQVRFFLRLNLIFVAMASLLILIVAETERREYLGFAESHAEELCEFLRGHLIYFRSRGREPLEILSSPEIIRKVTSEFGRLTDLRRVRVTFQGWQMEMSIAENWTVRHEVYLEAQPPRQQAPAERGWMTPLTPVPVVYGGQLLGRIELDESLRTINARVARQMRIIFLTFTVAVFLAAALFGFSVQHAHKTIQRQFKELERTHAQLAHAARLASGGQLAGGVAHEINNPAGIILTTSDYVLSEAERQGFPQSLREGLEAIRRQARRISDIVSGQLTFSRPTLLNMQRTQINTVLQQSLALVTPRFRQQRVHVEHHLAKDLPEITADPDRLEQVAADRALAITSERLRDYIAVRQGEGAAPATINRELDGFHTAFSLALHYGTLAMGPKCPSLPEHNARQGFFERGDFYAVLAHIGDLDVSDFLEFFYRTGMRPGEIRSLTWPSLDRETWTLRLHAKDAKTGFRSGDCPGRPAAADHKAPSQR